MPFITAGQPTINLKGTRPRPPESLSITIRHRLSLRFSWAIDEEPLFATEGLTTAQASMLSGKLFEACYKQVFAQSEET